MNCSTCSVRSLVLSKGPGETVNYERRSGGSMFSAAQIPIREIVVSELYIDGMRVGLNDTLDGLELRSSIQMESKGNIDADRIVTNDFVLDEDGVTPLLEDVHVYTGSNGDVVDANTGDVYTLLNNGDLEHGKLYNARFRHGIDDAVSLLHAHEVSCALHMFSGVYGGALTETHIPEREDPASYVPIFDATHPEFLPDLFWWNLCSGHHEAPRVRNVEVWTKSEAGAFQRKHVCIPVAMLGNTVVSVVSYGEEVSVEIDDTVGMGSLELETIIDGNWDATDSFIVHQAARRWSQLVTQPHKIVINVSFEQLESGILGSAGPTSFEYKHGRWFSTAGMMTLNTTYWNAEKARFKWNFRSHAYYTLLHEMGHILGIGTLWTYHGLLSQGPWYEMSDFWNADYTTALYTGVNAVREYKSILSATGVDVSKVLGIPVEDDGGVGTKGGHLEEGDNHLQRIFDGVVHGGLDHELMTGWSESTNDPEPLSRITVGMLHDLGYSVDYPKADVYIYKL